MLKQSRNMFDFTLSAELQVRGRDTRGNITNLQILLFLRPYRYFSIALKRILSLSDRYKIFASDCLWIEVCH